MLSWSPRHANGRSSGGDLSDDTRSKGGSTGSATASTGVRRAIDDLQLKIDEARTETTPTPSSEPSRPPGQLRRFGLILVAAGIFLALVVVVVAVAVNSGGHSSHPTATASLDAYLAAHAPPDSYVGLVTGAPDLVPSSYQTVAVASPADLTSLQLKWVLVSNPPAKDLTTAAVLRGGVLVATVPKSVLLYELGSPAKATTGTTTPRATAPAVTTPAVTTPAVTTPAVTTPAVTTPSVTTPAVTAPPPTTPTTTPVRGPPTEGPAPPPNLVPTAISVATGDSFWSIATRVATTRFGASPSTAEITSVWHALITANANRLIQPGNPNLIYPGQVFVVPTPP